MICTNCNAPLPDHAAFCPYCGTAVPQQPASGQPEGQAAPADSPRTAAYAAPFTDTLFLACCILVSVSTLSSVSVLYDIFLSSDSSGNLLGAAISILFTIFMWQIYAAARKNTLAVQPMRAISGVTLAQVVLNWVQIGLYGLGGILILNTDRILEIFGALSNGWELLYGFGDAEIFSFFGKTDGVGFLLVAMMLAVINLLGYRTIHLFAKSFYLAAQDGSVCPERLDAARKWILAIGIIKGVGALLSVGAPIALVANGCQAAAYILAFAWLSK